MSCNYCSVVKGTILEFDLSYYAIVGGEEMRRIEERIVSMVNGKSIVCVATKQEQMERKETGQHIRVKKALLYSNSSK